MKEIMLGEIAIDFDGNVVTPKDEKAAEEEITETLEELQEREFNYLERNYSAYFEEPRRSVYGF